MRLRSVEWEQKVPRPRGEVFAFFSDAQNLEKITPAFLNFQIVSMSTPQIQENTEIVYRLRLRGLPLRWKTLIAEWNPPHHFVDVQLEGPYAWWHHTHSFTESEGVTTIHDKIEYALPFGRLGLLLAGPMVARDVQSIFAYRQKIIAELMG